ncbi:MAG: DNA repair protein RecN [Alphaproteobacteria bacterium]|nr:DNA repair protein RecN [Alphaproteobacteria bacterium]
MLKSLSVKNVVLIDSLDIDFGRGLIVLSGETGAGKSILLDSLGLLLGNKTDTGLIRNGEEKLSVTGVFDVSPQNKIFELAEKYELDIDGDIIIKRTISADGKSKILFNDQIITLKLLKELAQYLIEIHGQHDNQGLLNPSTHLNILDAYGGYTKELDTVKNTYLAYKTAQKEFNEKSAKLQKAAEDEENIRHWVQELEKVAPQKGEEEELRQRRSEMMNAEKIIEKLNTAYTALNANTSVIDNISKARNAIARANEIVNNKYSEIEQILENALYTLSEAINQIEASSTEITINQNEIDNIETRLFLLKDLAKKHQTEINLLPEKLQELSVTLNNLELGADDLEELKRKVNSLRENYILSAQKLSQSRQSAAKKLDKSIAKELPPLKMDKAHFQTTITQKKEEHWTEEGCDNVCFEVSTNPNTPLGPLNKIASGGELSRFMLALKVNLAEQSHEETLIFDEIDTGIGGATAEAVGERLSRLSQKEQIFVVTHSPQVAAFSNEHFKVEKYTTGNITTTTLTKLNNKGKVEEIARMLAGEKISEEARAAAYVLLNKDSKQTPDPKSKGA